jgi:hypothetical protein
VESKVTEAMKNTQGKIVAANEEVKKVKIAPRQEKKEAAPTGAALLA